jgi:acetoin utilization protein AcuC
MMATDPLIVYVGADLERYGFGSGHPFGVDRLGAFWRETRRRGLDRRLTVVQPVPCSEEDLLLFHDPEYVRLVRARSVIGIGYLDDGDTPAFEGMYEAASFIVGSGLDAVERIVAGRARRAFIPIGGLHHGRRQRAAGFCVFNDCGVLIEALRRRHGLRRIAYVDIDAHHGDGVFYSFEDDPELAIVDVHEDGRFLYPGTGDAGETGSGEAAGTKLNLPLPPGSGESRFFSLWPRIEQFVDAARPQLIMLQAGADSIAGDPLADLALTPACHAHAAEGLRRLADRHCDGRLIVFGGGGYHRGNLATAWNDVLERLLGSRPAAAGDAPG